MRQIIKLTLLFAADYRFVKIDFPNATQTLANGINARGDIVGRYSDVEGVFHGFLLRKGVFSTIDFPGASLTAAFALNARGDIAGRFTDANGIDHGFLLSDGKFTQIDYPGAAGTWARGINNAGDIVGSHFNAAGIERGFLLKDGTFLNIHVPNSFCEHMGMAQDNGRVLAGSFCNAPDGTLYASDPNWGKGTGQIWRIGRDRKPSALATGDVALAYADPDHPDRVAVVHWDPERGVQVRRLRPEPLR